MKLRITIAMDNEAFEPTAGTEAARILRDLADKIEISNLTDGYDRKVNLRDINGNTVGEFTVR